MNLTHEQLTEIIKVFATNNLNFLNSNEKQRQALASMIIAADDLVTRISVLKHADKPLRATKQKHLDDKIKDMVTEFFESIEKQDNGSQTSKA